MNDIENDENDEDKDNDDGESVVTNISYEECDDCK